MEAALAIVAALLPAIAQVVKVFFGMDKPEKVEVIDHETPVPAGSDDDLLADFGLRPVDRPADKH
jgi:hypothetical protein